MQGGLNNSFFWLIIFIAITYFLMIRPQSKQKKKRQELLNNLEKGDRIVTIGGMYGTITALDDNTMVLEIAPNVRVTMQRSALGFVAVEEEKIDKNEEKKEEDQGEEGE